MMMMIGMAVAVGVVTMRLAMIVTRRRRHMMIGAQRSVRGERKRGHDRESGRNPSAHQMGETNHPRTGQRCIYTILIGGLPPVQIDDDSQSNYADLVAFGKIYGGETEQTSKPLGNQHRRLSIEHPQIWPKSSSCRIRIGCKA
jgi:hypothetical protein